MNTPPTVAMVERLLGLEGGLRLSLYMPTHRAGAEIWQDPIRCKNLIRDGQEKLLALEGKSVSNEEIRELIDPLLDLQQDREFWQHQEDGLAIFRAAGTMEVFRLPVELPELCTVGTRFHLKPFLMALAAERQFVVLSLSQNHVKLLRGSASGLSEVDLAFDPNAASSENEGTTLRAQTTTSGARLTNSVERDRKAQIAAYCRKVDQAVAAVVKPGELIILAAVDYVANIYREISSLRNIAAKGIHGNPENTSIGDLHAVALVIANEQFDQDRQVLEERFLTRLHHGSGLDDPAAIILAAREGRLDMVVVPIGVHVWGHIDADGTVQLTNEPGPQDEDLLNNVLIDTWKAGGRVLAVPPTHIPGGRLVAATTRY